MADITKNILSYFPFEGETEKFQIENQSQVQLQVPKSHKPQNISKLFPFPIENQCKIWYSHGICPKQASMQAKIYKVQLKL